MGKVIMQWELYVHAKSGWAAGWVMTLGERLMPTCASSKMPWHKYFLDCHTGVLVGTMDRGQDC